MIDTEANQKNILKESILEFREYQKTIAQKCILKNSLIVLPTGLGKTIVAVYVVAYTLQKYANDSKVIVLAPTRPLINQHYDLFIKYLSISKQQFEVLTGKVSPERRTELFQKNQILFYTPQTLRNDLVSKRYSLQKVCLIIFDEAHHASGDFPYTMISDAYIEQNPDGTILALTASPGASKKKIKELCQALHIPPENIHTRTRMDKDVKIYLKPMDIFKIGVDMTSLMKGAYQILSRLLEERLQYLSQFNFLEEKADVLVEKVIRKDLIKLNSELLSLLEQDEDKTGIYSAISINAQALILFHMIELVEQQGLDILLIYLQKLNSDARKKSSSKAVKILAADHRLQHFYLELKQQEELNPTSLVHPKYDLLKSILLKEVDRNPKVRILVFVKLRDSVQNLITKLKLYPLISAARFVGQATKSTSDKGLSQKKQLEILDKFKSGQLNILISTNVGEEGLDIAECDLVIFYDVVVSETRFIQRRGRTARHRKGKVIILYSKGTKDEVYLRIALMKMKKMNINLKNSNFRESDSKLRNPDLKLNHISSENQDLKDHDNLSTKNQATLQKFLFSPLQDQDEYKRKNEIQLSKSIPVKFALRSKLKKDNIPFDVSPHKNHIELFKDILIHIYNPYDFSEEKLSSTIKRISILMKKYKLVLNIVDFIDYREKYCGEENLLKKKIKNLEDQLEMSLIAIDNLEELYFMIKNIYLYNKEKGNV